MGSTKHEKSFVDYDKSYEQNIVGLRGVVYFGVFLLLLIVVTFVLMFFLINVMEDQASQDKDVMTPMRREAIEKNPDVFLPPEPRLQSAPGFGVDGENGRINLELKEPQSEWWELERKWNAELANGQKDQKTGTVITLPIEEAKNRLMQENIKARPAEQGQKALEESRSIISYSSAGRVANEKRR
ncbi:MAG TPA: hypothetical protein VGB68_09325 [Pyrinomonadaceae bacterium]|jgi:hypothetical protein